MALHSADVLALAANDAEDTVFAAGIDNAICMLSKAATGDVWSY